MPVKSVRGFTLVELIMVIALAAVVAVMVSVIMSRPLQSFVDQSRRAALTDLATVALQRMARDIRLAVPNSVRVSGTCTATSTSCRLEFLRSQVGGRYRANLAAGVRRDPPVCTGSPCSIEVLSPFSAEDLAQVATANWMVIYNIGGTAAGNNVWPPASASLSVISPQAAFSYAGGTLTLTGSGVAGFRFKYASPQHRFFLADKVAGYDCTDALVRRKEFTTLSATSDYDYSNAAQLVSSVSGCSFSYNPGTAQRGGLITLQLTLSQAGEQISLVEQVHVDNAP